MNYIAALEKRHACKRMNHTKIEPEKLDRIIKSIQLSASSYGLQAYQVMAIQNNNIKKEIQPFCMNQAQIIECDTLLIFLAFTKVNPDYIENYIQKAATKRGLSLEKLEPYKDIIKTKTQEAYEAKTLTHWASKQTYIALGTALTTCALEGVDACPIEGFDAEQINAYFKLDEQGLHASVMLAIGNKDETLDFNAKLPKYRKDLNELIIWKK